CYCPARGVRSSPRRRSSDLARGPGARPGARLVAQRVGSRLGGAVGADDRGSAVPVVEIDALVRVLPGLRGEELAQGGERGALLRSEEHTSELQSRENLVCRL